jgi:hypothetical protein
VQLRADLRGVGVVELVEDLDRAPKGAAGGIGVADGVVGVTEMHEDVGLVVPVAERAVQVEGLPA